MDTDRRTVNIWKECPTHILDAGRKMNRQDAKSAKKRRIQIFHLGALGVLAVQFVLSRFDP
jgi:hypothetical protein